jgi:hypothetical protein
LELFFETAELMPQPREVLSRRHFGFCYMRRISILIALAVASMAAPIARAHAELGDVTIQDVNGFTRAVAQVDGTGKVEFTVNDSNGEALDGAVIILSNSATGETLTSTSVGGIVTFDSVTPGIWTVTSESSGVTFASAIITGAAVSGFGASTAAATAYTVGGVGAVGAGTAIAIDHAGGNHRDEEPPPLSPAS